MGVIDTSLSIGCYETEYGSTYPKWKNGTPDSAGGFDVRINFTNNTGKTIKYITFVVVPYNSVGDIVASEINSEPEARLQFTGPLETGKSNNGHWSPVWYNWSISKAAIQSVEIKFMDDTEMTVPGNELGEQKGGCYVATAVYGSYNCPEVWTLRRYRDFKLAETWYGRSFIHTYYAISPTLVKKFGNTEWFKKMWKTKLDRMVRTLNNEGISNKPYDDINW